MGAEQENVILREMVEELEKELQWYRKLLFHSENMDVNGPEISE